MVVQLMLQQSERMKMKMSAYVKGLAGDDVKVECENQAEEWPIRKQGWRSGRK